MAEKTIYVHAGWTRGNEIIGEINISNVRGRETISFEYQRSWLQAHPGLLIDPQLHTFTGRQFPEAGRSTFGFLSDSAPDRWGRTLMDRREIIQARQENRPVHKLLDSDYMLGVHDGGRVGGLRFSETGNPPFLSDTEELAAPPMAQLRRLEHSSRAYEKDHSYEEKWIHDLIAPGSSLGGARPKANVIDTDQSMWIAKFPSANDRINVGAWEMVAHELARFCSLRVPDAKLMRFSDAGDTYLVRRFDRIRTENDEKKANNTQQKDESTTSGQTRQENVATRIHFASAMTMLGESDGTNNPVGYIDIAQVLEEISSQAEADIQELWKRMVFNILISNADDHLRNHGFLLSGEMWTLSPMYDVNPEYDARYLSLNIGENDNTKDIRLAIDEAEYYRIPRDTAIQTIRAMQQTISRNWRSQAAACHIPAGEQKLMEQAFAECERQV